MQNSMPEIVFPLVDEKASELGLSVENRYRVTDKLVQDMIRLARKERPDMFLLGAGSKYRPDTAGSNGGAVALSVSR